MMIKTKPILNAIVSAASIVIFSGSIALAQESANLTRATNIAHQRWQQSITAIASKDGTFKAVTRLNPQAEAQAKQVDQFAEQNANATSMLLGGTPILVKDNIDVAGMATTAGSMALANNVPAESADLIQRLESHGAVILGKTNLSEWANFRSEKSSSGWSAIGGQTKNAIDQSRSPCGSSSGSAVAVALGYVDVAIGTETNGSIVCPASVNGVIGFKPTHGLVSAEGIVPLAPSQDTAGPISNTVENAAHALAAMMLDDTPRLAKIKRELREVSNGTPLKGMRIGIIAATQGYDKRRDELLDAAVAKLKHAGVEIIEGLNAPIPNKFWEDSYQVLQYEFKQALNRYFSERVYEDADNPLKNMTLEKLIRFNNDNASKELKHFDQDIFEKSQSLRVTEKDYRAMLSRIRNTTRDQGLDKLFDEHRLDAVIGITYGPAWKIDHINGDAFFGPAMSTFPAIGGHPHITVPGGNVASMPIGLSFVGKRFEDAKLAQLAYRFQQLKPSRKPPIGK